MKTTGKKVVLTNRNESRRANEKRRQVAETSNRKIDRAIRNRDFSEF